MKFDGVKKVDEGRFISRYDLYYTTEDDKKKVYEIISRNKEILPNPFGNFIATTPFAAIIE